MSKNLSSHFIHSQIQYNYNCKFHKNQKIVLICQQKQCSYKRKSCVLCIDQQHQGHHVISIQKFFKDLQNNLQKNNNNSQKKQITKLLEKTKQQFIQKIQRIKLTLFNLLNSLENLFYPYVSSLNDMLNINKHDIIKYHILKTFQTQKQGEIILNDYLNLSEKAKNIQFGTLKDTKKLTNYFIQELEYNVENINNNIEQSFEKIKKFLGDLKFTGKKDKNSNILSQKNKSISIQISDSLNGISQIIPRGTNFIYPICCLQRKIDLINNSFYVKIQKCQAKRIFFGVCILDIVQSVKFNNVVGLNRGSYAIDQSSSINVPNSYASVWNHTSAIHNQCSYYTQTSSTSWSINEGDIARVYVDYNLKQIKFCILNQKLSEQNISNSDYYKHEFSMPISLDQGDLYPFIGTNSIGNKDNVIILSSQQIDTIYARHQIKPKQPLSIILQNIDYACQQQQQEQLLENSNTQFSGEINSQSQQDNQNENQIQYANQQSYDSQQENLFD